MFTNMPAGQQYTILASVTLAVVFVGLWLYNRREKRRERADAIGDLMLKWELTWTAELFRMYSRGDYSGLVHKTKEVIQAVRTDAVIVEKLFDCACKVAKWCVENAPEKATKLREILAEKATTAKK